VATDAIAHEDRSLPRRPVLAAGGAAAAAALLAACGGGRSSTAGSGDASSSSSGSASAPAAGGGALVERSIANLTTSPAKVVIRVIDDDAELTRAGPAPLPGHKSRSAAAFCSGICNRPRCEFATDKPVGGFRASACVADHTSTNASKVCLPAP
jgi:hypothetical protein